MNENKPKKSFIIFSYQFNAFNVHQTEDCQSDLNYKERRPYLATAMMLECCSNKSNEVQMKSTYIDLTLNLQITGLIETLRYMVFMII